jgi:hypothetical protein
MSEARNASQYLNSGEASKGRERRELAFCPYCYAQIQASEIVCEACGADLENWNARSYAERLIQALGHPLADVRMRAIIALGWRLEKKAERALVECALRHPTDVVEGLEIVEALRLIREGSTQFEGLRILERDHSASSVRQAATAALSAAQPGDSERFGKCQNRGSSS